MPTSSALNERRDKRRAPDISGLFKKRESYHCSPGLCPGVSVAKDKFGPNGTRPPAGGRGCIGFIKLNYVSDTVTVFVSV